VTFLERGADPRRDRERKNSHRFCGYDGGDRLEDYDTVGENNKGGGSFDKSASQPLQWGKRPPMQIKIRCHGNADRPRGRDLDKQMRREKLKRPRKSKGKKTVGRQGGDVAVRGSTYFKL